MKRPQALSGRVAAIGVLLVLLALFGQLLATIRVPGPDELLLADGAICHSDPGIADSVPSHSSNHGVDCALCPFCVSLAAPASPLVAPPAIPAPLVVVVRQPQLRPPARAPPVFRIAAAQPRGPPRPGLT
jgi:Protein of unknown function (DUF2946)